MDKSARQRWINIAMVAVVIVVLAGIGLAYWSQCDAYDCPNVQMFVESFGPWAPLVYAVLYIASSPIPFVSLVLSAAGGLLFGPVLGALYAVLIATISSLVPFVIARRLGRDWVASKLEGRKLDAIYQQSGGSQGFLFVLLMRLIPILPWEIQNYVAGLSQVKVPTFLLATVAGIIPATTSLTFLGASVQDPSSWQFYAALGVNAVVMAVPSVALLVRRRKKKRAERAEEAGER